MRHHPGEVIDRYEILDSLGEGAYAETYKALDTRSGATLVLKMPNPNLFADPGLFQRYRRESDIARKLDHPGVQRGVDGGDTRTEPYLVLEYIDGDNLRRVLRSGPGYKPFLQVRVRFFVQQSRKPAAQRPFEIGLEGREKLLRDLVGHLDRWPAASSLPPWQGHFPSPSGHRHASNGCWL